MNKIDFKHFFFLGIAWWLSEWIVIYLAGSEKNLTTKEYLENYKTWNICRHAICGFIFIIFVYNVITDS